MIAYIFIPSGRLPILLCNDVRALREPHVLEGYARVCQQMIDTAPCLEVWQ